MPWNPLNKYCWDFWFAWQDQTLHVFYLQASTLGCAYNPDRRHNQASIGHAVMTDWGWQELHPDRPVLDRREEAWDSMAIWTGSIIAHAELYYLIYSARRRGDRLIATAHERRLPQNIGVAVSKDLEHWERTPASLKAPVIPNPGVESEFDGINWRDPYVIHDETDQLFYAFICARPHESLPDAGGCIAYAASPDLADWSQPYGTLYTSDRFYLLEVPQVFWRRTNDGQHWRFYLLFAPHWSPFFAHDMQIGVTYYVRSRPIRDRQSMRYDQIPWEAESEELLSDGLFAGKLINPETEDFPTFLGFQKEDEGGHFVGGLSDPQWAIFADDGRIHLSRSHPTPHRSIP
jgi:beta-fructofuranosidase